MSQGEQQIIKVQIHHELIGNHNFELSGKTHTSDLRLHILENSPLYIHENFHLELQGTRLQQCNEISEIFKTDVRLAVVFDQYDLFSSRYHQMKVRKILANPEQWAIVNSRDYSNKIGEEEKQDFPSLSLDNLFEQPFQSVLLEGSEKMANDFSNIIYSSGFNPPSTQRKLVGDLYYLQIKTVEEIDYHITANSYGFFVNQSTQGNFSPHPHPKFSSSISLLDLLYQVSPKFKLQFQEVLKNVKVSEFQRLSQGQKIVTTNNDWMVESINWKKQNSWKNDAYQYSYKNDYTVIKDWVQIFQYQQTSSSDSFLEKIGKEKLRYRIYQEFIQSVKDCVVKIFNGAMEPLNIASKLQHRIFYYSGLLFYFANQDLKRDHLRPSGYSANKQISTQAMLQHIDIDNVYLSHSAVVTYRGFKIVAKAVPNSLIKYRQQNQTVKDIFQRDNKAQSDEVIMSALKKISRSLGLESEVLSLEQNGVPKMLCVSHQLSGCTSNETKRFLLQTKGFSVRDLNFNKQDPNQCYLRPQLIKIYNTNQKCQILYNSSIGTGCNLSNTQKHKQQLKKLQSVAKFAKEIMVPSVIDSFDAEMRKYLSDSHNIVSVLHKFGLSCKYLGLVCKKASEKKAEHVKIMIERTILVRSLKGFFKKALRSSPLFFHKTVIKNLLNCLFQNEESKEFNHKEIKTDDETDLNVSSRKNKKRKNKDNETYFEISLGKPQEKYCRINEVQFWEEVEEIALAKFQHKLGDKASFFVFQFSKVAILRDLCLCLGMVLEKKDYFSTQGSTIFTEENIVNLIPKIKIVTNDPKELNDLIEEGDRQTNKFQIQEAFDTYNKAFQYIFSSFGETHEKLGLMYKKFAGLHYKIGDLDAAVLFALNSYEIYELLKGKDHVQAIEALMMVGIYEFGRKKFAAAEYYMLKAIFLAKLAYSECYPEVIVMYMNISTVYEAQKKYTDAIMSLFMALNISIRVYGQFHLHTAIIFSALASLHYDIPDIQQTIKFQQKAITILEELLGNQDERVVEAKNICEGYKNIQNSKKVRQVHEKEQRNAYGLPSLSKMNMKAPFYDMRERGSADFFWKKSRRLKYFF